MASKFGSQPVERGGLGPGFSLLELLTSVAIITLLMGAVFSFMFQAQKRLQGSLVISESNQTARAAMELMTQEIGQTGFNPQFTTTKNITQNFTASSNANCVTVSSLTGINPGDWLTVDTGANYEIVQVLATSNGAISGSTKCVGSSEIRAIFLANHTPQPIPIASYKFPYPTGILRSATVSWGGTNVTVSNDHMLAFFGDINNDGTVYYIVYSLYNPTAGSPPPQVSIPVGGTPTTFYLYNLYRSITPVTFDSGATNANNKASPLVENVVYLDFTAAGPWASCIDTSKPCGPTGQPIFAYPNPVSVQLIPSVVSVVGTVVINLCVAVNPKAIETGSTVQWYTMASQIRPLNLWSAVTVSQTGGAKYLAQTPLGMPMTFPATLANYYF